MGNNLNHVAQWPRATQVLRAARGSIATMTERRLPGLLRVSQSGLTRSILSFALALFLHHFKHR